MNTSPTGCPCFSKWSTNKQIQTALIGFSWLKGHLKLEGKNGDGKGIEEEGLMNTYYFNV